ncbi:hypothetical protein HYV88_01580 [Candidatus Woesearchaeota archaeon]|nr:hypothetical protein [Candidatus Woesearchaeota archaeon]
MLNLENMVRTAPKVGEIGGGLATATAGAVTGPGLLGQYITGATVGYSNAAIAGSVIGTPVGMVLGYAGVNTALKGIYDLYYTMRHPIKQTKRILSTLGNIIKRPYRILTKPLEYVFKPVRLIR